MATKCYCCDEDAEAKCEACQVPLCARCLASHSTWDEEPTDPGRRHCAECEQCEEQCADSSQDREHCYD